MIVVSLIGALLVIWRIYRVARRLLNFTGKLNASRVHFLDPGDQLKVFLTKRDLVAPTRAFDDTYGSDDTETVPTASVAIDEAIARALKEKAAPASLPAVIAQSPGFGRRRAG